MAKQRLIVVGNGMAGARTVEEILSRGGAEQYQIEMFGDEPYGNYNRILLSNVLLGSQDASEIFLNDLAWYEANGITLHAGARVTHIDRASKWVHATAAGIRKPYDKLIIATGSRPFLPPIEGLHAADGELRHGVYGFRTLDDCTAIAKTAKDAKKAVVIGGGLLGLEAARGLLNFGCEVHIVHLASRLMNAQLDDGAAHMLNESMKKMGVHVHLDKATSKIVGNGVVTGVEFKDGSTLECDMVVVSAGIKPNSEIGHAAGLTVERAIVVDNHMRSVDDPNVYVVGECAQHRGKVYGLVAPLWDQAKVLADHITQVNPRAQYTGSKLGTKLKVMGVELACMGMPDPGEPGDEVVQFSEPKRGQYKKLIIRNGRLIGAILLGDSAKAPYLLQAFENNTPLPDERLSLLFDIGAPAAAVTFAEMPDEAQVCNCNGVSKSQIGEAVKCGERTPKGVMKATRAGMGCGSCKQAVNDLVAYFCDGAVEEDPSADYYIPSIPLNKTDLMKEVRERGLKSAYDVFMALGDGLEDAASKPALASMLRIVWNDEYDDQRDARFINDRVHANIQKDGTFTVVPEMAGGVCTADELRRIADAADKYNVPLIKVTGGQRIDLVGVAKDDLPKMWKDLGMPAGTAWSKAYRTCKSCIGVDYCRYGLGDSMALAGKIEKRYRGLDSPAKLKLATAGCPRNCSEAMVKDLGAVAVEGGKWEIYIGGAAGAHIRKGDKLCTVDDHDGVMTISGRFMQYYREQAKYKERTYTFVERIGVDALRKIIVEDSEGLAAGLDERMQLAVEACYDPWLERDKPITNNQFKQLLPVVQP